MKRACGVSWLRIRIANTKHSNLRELLPADLTTKMRKGVISLDFKNAGFNCVGVKGDDLCAYKGKM